MRTASLGDFTKAEALDALRAQRARTLELYEGLSASAWDEPALPGWRVREVAAHLITTDEGALTGRMLRLGLAQRPISDVEAWNETQVGRWADRPVPALLAALERWGSRMARAVALQPGALMRPRIPTPFGRVSIAWLVMLRVYDEWVHGEDVRRALGLAPDDAPERVRPAARLLFAAMPMQALPRLSPAASGCVEIRLEDLDLPAVGVDMDARRYGVAISGGSVLLARAGPLIMVAAGRDAWRDAEASGSLRIAGDRAPTEAILDALRVV